LKNRFPDSIVFDFLKSDLFFKISRSRGKKFFAPALWSHTRGDCDCGGEGIIMEIRYSERADKQIKKICKGDRKSAKMIIKMIEAYAENPSGNFDIKILRGKFENLKRLRIGNYRVIFDDYSDIMSIYEIKHRQEVYHD
jgi:mRNA-degrading endonuclease RelE of RelBE toxin-antitoxin system